MTQMNPSNQYEIIKSVYCSGTQPALRGEPSTQYEHFKAVYDPTYPALRICIVNPQWLPLSGGTIDGNLSITGDLNVSGLTNMVDVYISNDLTVDGDLTVTGVTETGELIVVEDATIYNLIVPGLAVINNLTVTGDTNIQGNLFVSGVTTLNELIVERDTYLSNTIIDGDLTINGQIISSGSTGGDCQGETTVTVEEVIKLPQSTVYVVNDDFKTPRPIKVVNKRTYVRPEPKKIIITPNKNYYIQMLREYWIGVKPDFSYCKQFKCGCGVNVSKTKEVLAAALKIYNENLKNFDAYAATIKQPIATAEEWDKLYDYGFQIVKPSTPNNIGKYIKGNAGKIQKLGDYLYQRVKITKPQGVIIRKR